MAAVNRRDPKSIAFKTSAYIFCGLLTILSLMPFVIMIVNSTRSTPQIQSHAISFIPSKYLLKNYACFAGRDFKPFLGFKNSLIISVGATVCNIYFSTMTAFALVAYDWKLRKPFFTVIMAVLMIPAKET